MGLRDDPDDADQENAGPGPLTSARFGSHRVEIADLGAVTLVPALAPLLVFF